jgi:hypothetical protein
LDHNVVDITERHLPNAKLACATNGRKRFLKQPKLPSDRVASRDKWVLALSAEPTCKLSYERCLVTIMRMDILTGDIRYVALETVWSSVEDNTAFCVVLAAAVPPCAKEHAKFEGHIEPRQPRTAAHLGARDVVNAILAFSDDCTNLFEPILCSIVSLKGTTDTETGTDDRECNGVEKGFKLLIERAVDENVSVPSGHGPTVCRGRD